MSELRLAVRDWTGMVMGLRYQGDMVFSRVWFKS